MTDRKTTDGPGPEDELARYRELEALVAAREEEEAGRWIVMAGFGLVVIAVSSLSWWWIAEAPTAVVAHTTAPVLVWVGLVPAAIAIVVGLARPNSRPLVVPAVTLAGALVVAAASVVAALDTAPGAAPWLALCGSLITSTSTITALTHTLANRRTRDEGGRRG